MCVKNHSFTRPDAVECGISTPDTTIADEVRERKRYERKSELLRRALLEADEMDNMTGLKEWRMPTMNDKTAMKPVYELTPGQPLADGQYDGMEDMLGDNDHLPTDWDVEIEDPPHDAWIAMCNAEKPNK